MNSFEQIGSAQLLAVEGQRQIAQALAKAVGRAFLRVVEGLVRYLPTSKATPW